MTRNPLSIPLYSHSKRFLLVLLLLIGLVRFSTLGLYPIFDSTEARYAEIPREMLATGNWVMPHLDPDRPFWGKPPLSFWLTALGYLALGVSEFSARLPHFLVALFSVWLTLRVASRFHGRKSGYFAALVLATTGLFHALAGGVMTDPTLAAAVALAMVGFLLAMDKSETKHRLAWGYAAFLGLGLSILAKGPVGAVLIGLPIVAWLSVTRQWKVAARRLPWINGALLALFLTAPWFLLAERKTPGFIDYFIVGEHFRRFLTPGWKGDLYGNPHEHPLGAIWLYGLVSTLPWGIPMAMACYQMRKIKGAVTAFFGDPVHLFYLFWFLSPLVFFTVSSNIIITYVLPGLPGFALLGARSVETALGRGEEKPNAPLSLFRRPGLQWGVALMAPVVYFLVAVTIMPFVGCVQSQKLIVRTLDIHDPDRLARFVYLKKAPYSADFYSGGRAEALLKTDTEAWEELSKNSTRDFVVVEEDHLESFSRISGGRFELLLQHSEYYLYIECASLVP